MERVTVTGGAGFIGSAFIWKLYLFRMRFFVLATQKFTAEHAEIAEKANSAKANSLCALCVLCGEKGNISALTSISEEGIDDILVVDSLGTAEKWKNLGRLCYSDYLHKSVFLERTTTDTLRFAPEAIVHMGACSSTTERNADYLMANNYHFTRTLAEWAVARGIRFLHASSAATYGSGEGGFR